jgi:hypothetical protein
MHHNRHQVVIHHFAQGGTDWAGWITAIATALLVVGAIAALWALQDARKTRDGQLVTDISRRWDETATIASIVAFSDQGPTGIITLLDRIYPTDPTVLPSKADRVLAYELFRWPTLIDTIGVLESKKAISSDVVYKLWGPQIVSAWKVWADPVQHMRELEGFPVTYRGFQDLAEAMEKRYAEDVERSGTATAAGESHRSESQSVAEAAEPPDEPTA